MVQKGVTNCDYVMDDQGRICIVTGYWHNDGILANVVYIPTIQGERFNPKTGVRYAKVIDQYKITEKILKSNITQTWYPRECYRKSKASGALSGTIWGKISDTLEELGVPSTAIGIFGSYLLSFPIIKDVDFVIYGTENCRRVQKMINILRKKINATGITEEHINYQIQKHAREFSPFNSFERLLCNKWSSLQISPGILSTLRFVYLPKEVPPDPFRHRILEETEIEGKVVDDFGTNFCPRTFVLETEEGHYTVATYFWIYQSCVTRGMNVKVLGNLREGNVITLDELTHGINVISRP